MCFEGAFFPVLWIVGWIGTSIAYRNARGKPVLFFGVPDASYQQRTASGYSHRSWLSKLGGASGCLVVAVADEHQIIRPFFFNLFFLPEIYGLEYEVPLHRFREAKLKTSLLRRRSSWSSETVLDRRRGSLSTCVIPKGFLRS